MSDFNTITDFTADKFIPTKWEPATKKAHFAKTFIRFVESDFDRSRFTQTFSATSLISTSRIFDTFFTSTEGKVRFLRLTLQHPCYGDQTCTYSDVERALQNWLRLHDLLAEYEQRLSDEIVAAEKAVLARLKVKYEAAVETK